MKNTVWRALSGIVLILIGVVSILQVLNIIVIKEAWWGLFFAGLFLFTGVLFLSVLIRDRKNWWASIAGFTLLGLSALMTASLINPSWERYGTFILFTGISLGFWVVCLINRQQWWAIIPAGITLSIAVSDLVEMTAAKQSLLITDSSALLLFGLAVTFFLVAILPAREFHTRWALIPAGVLLTVSLLNGLSATPYSQFIWPVILIAAGCYLAIKALTRNG